MRLITEFEERVFRCRHHDFGALTTKETAVLLGVSERRVRDALARVKKTSARILFPILTRQQAACYKAYQACYPAAAVAKELKITESTVYWHLEAVKSKGLPFSKPAGKTLSYHPGMDEHTRRTF